MCKILTFVVLYYAISVLLALISLFKLAIYSVNKKRKTYPVLYKQHCIDTMIICITGVWLFLLIKNSFS